MLRLLLKALRIRADIHAVRRGPRGVAQRLVRRSGYRAIRRWTR